MDKRAQGRPCRGGNEVGRTKIVETIRIVLRSGECADTSRKSLALHVGITPALITYYFPKKESLMYAVVTPVIESYRALLETIVASEAAAEIKLRHIIELLAELYGKDAKILGIYRALEENEPEVYGGLDAMTSILSDFFFSWRGDPQSRSFDVAVLQGAVRGMCEFAKRVRAEQSSAEAMNIEDVGIDWLEPLHQLFTMGRDLFVPATVHNAIAVAV